jgi:hypothetical protein
MADKTEPEKIHPVVDLMLRRMGSHPEEFFGGITVASRWHEILGVITTNGSEEEQRLIAEKFRRINLDAAHTMALDELCNGEARREEARRVSEVRQTTLVTSGSGGAGGYLANTNAVNAPKIPVRNICVR